MTPAACTPPDPPPPRRHLAAVPDDRAASLGLVVDRLRSRIRAGEVGPFDGMVWLAHLGRDGAPRLFSRVSDPVADLDELYVLDLLTTLDAIALPRVVVAIWRSSGQPAAIDRRLTRDLVDRLAAGSPRTVLDAVVIVNSTGYRIVRPGRASRRAERVPRTGPAPRAVSDDEAGPP